MLGLSIPSVAYRNNQASLAARVAALFRNGEQAVWFDPSDISTLYQDAAGTTPVTAMEQPVGLMLDKSGRGNHCTFKAGTGRPVLSARYNLLTYTEQFDNAAWGKANAAVTQNAVSAPDGTTTSDLLVESATNAQHYILSPQFSSTSGASYTAQVFLKAGGRNFGALYLGTSAFPAGSIVFFNLTTGTITSVGAGVTSSEITSVGNGWYRVRLTAIANATVTNATSSIYLSNVANSSAAYQGDGTSGIYIWGADLRATNDGIGLPAYQRVVDSATYDAAGFPAYLHADGTDDGGSTNSIDFTGTDKVTVFAGVRKLRDAAGMCLYELSSSIDTNTGAFDALIPAAATQPNYLLRSKGTEPSSAITPSNYAAPHTSVLTHIASIGDDINKVRVNGTQVAAVTTDQGTGNFGNYPLFLFARNNASIYFNGRLYGLIVLGRAATAMEIANTERYLNQRGRIY